MSLASLIIILVVVGLVMYLINTYLPMDAQIKRILNIAVILFLIIWLIQTFVGIPDIRIGR